MLMTLFYHDIELLYWPGDDKLQEIEWEPWNNAVCRHRRRMMHDAAKRMLSQRGLIWSLRTTTG